MTKRFIPFTPTMGTSVDQGTIGSLSYIIYNCGMIVFSDNAGLSFKADLKKFRQLIKRYDPFGSINIREPIEFRGDDNGDILVMSVKDCDIVLSLKKRGFETFRKLNKIMAEGEAKISK